MTMDFNKCYGVVYLEIYWEFYCLTIQDLYMKVYTEIYDEDMMVNIEDWRDYRLERSNPGTSLLISIEFNEKENESRLCHGLGLSSFQYENIAGLFCYDCSSCMLNSMENKAKVVFVTAQSWIDFIMELLITPFHHGMAICSTGYDYLQDYVYLENHWINLNIECKVNKLLNILFCRNFSTTWMEKEAGKRINRLRLESETEEQQFLIPPTDNWSWGKNQNIQQGFIG